MVEVGTGRPVWSFGVMTGTSMDGVDIAVIRTDGENVLECHDSASLPIRGACREIVARAIGKIAEVPTDRLRRRGDWPGWLRVAERAVSGEIDHAVAQFLAGAGVHDGGTPRREPWISIAGAWEQTCSGVHGQTIVHRPEEHFTLQIGARAYRGDAMSQQHNASFFHARATEVFDFRSDDMEAGGEGAPLAPFYHFALARKTGAEAPVAFLNIGGVANVTWVDPSQPAPSREGALLAFDTGPGNALVNDWMQATRGAAMDEDGRTAARGRVHRDRLQSNAARAYLDRVPPKSLDRNDFSAVLAGMEGLSAEDGAATLTAFTVECVAESLKHMPSPPTRWLVCGGGRKNATMMQGLGAALGAPVEPVEAVGLDGDMLEAQAFAYLAVRVIRGLPTSAPGTTGCREPVCGGRVASPARNQLTTLDE